jgi:hypothetical protein
VHRAPRRADPGRQDQVLEVDAGIAGGREGHEGLGLGVDAIDHRGRRGQQGAYAFRDALRHVARLQ